MTTALKENSQSAIETALLTFNDAIELSGNLEIIGAAQAENPKSEIRNPKSDDEVFVIRDHNTPVGIEGAYIEVSITEIIKNVGAKSPRRSLSGDGCSPFGRAQEFVNVINNVRQPIVLQGITRIVGYYSRVNNWNKSKVGELRDRANGSYGLTSNYPLFHKDRMSAINAL